MKIEIYIIIILSGSFFIQIILVQLFDKQIIYFYFYDTIYDCIIL